MSRSRNRAIVAKQVAFREKLWPYVTDSDLWLRKQRDGFVSIPRGMPLIGLIMDGMNKGHPVSSVYLDLWCNVMDEMFISLKSHDLMAFHSGYEGERAKRTWRERMTRLKDDGFIDFKPGPLGEISYVLLLNPYHVIRRHYEDKHPAVTDARYTALMARLHEIGAEDLTETLPTDPLKRESHPSQISKVDFELDDEIPF